MSVSEYSPLTCSVSVVVWHSKNRGTNPNCGIHGVFADHDMACAEADRLNRTRPDVHEAVSYVIIPSSLLDIASI